MSDPSRLDRPPLPTPERIAAATEFLSRYAHQLTDSWGCDHRSEFNEWCVKCREDATDGIRDLLAALDAATAERDAAERAAAVVAVDFVTVSDARNAALARAEALEAELSRLRALTTWQPIETAPKDGTPILAWRAGWSYPSPVLWLDGPGIGGPAWRRYEGAPQTKYYPTIWQPLPAPPAEDRAKEGR